MMESIVALAHDSQYVQTDGSLRWIPVQLGERWSNTE